MVTDGWAKVGSGQGGIASHCVRARATVRAPNPARSAAQDEAPALSAWPAGGAARPGGWRWRLALIGNAALDAWHRVSTTAPKKIARLHVTVQHRAIFTSL